MHDFIALIFYMFRRAVPPALIGLAVGAALLVPLNRKRRREEARFPRGQAAAILLLLCYLGGLASVTFMNRMESGMGIGIQLRPFLAFWEAECLYPPGLAKSPAECCHVPPPGRAAPSVCETVSAVVLDAGGGSGTGSGYAMCIFPGY